VSEPITDAELTSILDAGPDGIGSDHLARLVAEIRRLRAIETAADGCRAILSEAARPYPEGTWGPANQGFARELLDLLDNPADPKKS
jgi:hypothetical protein